MSDGWIVLELCIMSPELSTGRPSCYWDKATVYFSRKFPKGLIMNRRDLAIAGTEGEHNE